MSDGATTTEDDPFERMRVIGEEVKARVAAEEDRERQLLEEFGPPPAENLVAARRGVKDFVHAAGPAGVSVDEVMAHWGITREQADEIYEMKKVGPGGGSKWLPLVARGDRWFHYEHLA